MRSFNICILLGFFVILKFVFLPSPTNPMWQSNNAVSQVVEKIPGNQMPSDAVASLDQSTDSRAFSGVPPDETTARQTNSPSSLGVPSDDFIARPTNSSASRDFLLDTIDRSSESRMSRVPSDTVARPTDSLASRVARSSLAPRLVLCPSSTLEHPSLPLHYRSPEAVSSDDVCFPPTLTLRPTKLRPFNLTRDVDYPSATSCRGYPNKYTDERFTLKSFRNASVFRLRLSPYHETTFYETESLLSFNRRCGPGRDVKFIWHVVRNYSLGMIPLAEREVVHLSQALLLDSQAWSKEYFHYMFEKVFTVGPARVLLESDPTMVLLMEFAPNGLMERLELLGINRTRIVVTAGKFIKVDVLHVPFTIFCFEISAEAVLSYRRWMRDRHPMPSTLPNQIILISRLIAGTVCNRCLLNSNEIYIALQGRFNGTFIVKHLELGNLPLREQLAEMSRTVLIIAPHGAALTNAVFMPLGGRMIEIMNDKRFCLLCFYSLAISLDMPYRLIGPVHLANGTILAKIGDVPKIIQSAEDLLMDLL